VVQQQRSSFRAQDFRRRWNGGEGVMREEPKVGMSAKDVAGMPVIDFTY
jgi:hypothetical protein